MASSITQVKNRIRAIIDTDSTFKRVVKASVTNLGTFPAAIVVHGPATHAFTADDLKQEVRDYEIIALAGSVQVGREFDVEEVAETLHPVIETLFDLRPGLWLTGGDPVVLPYVQAAYLVSDAGYVVIPLAGGLYGGSSWTLRVETLEQIARGH